LRRRDFIRVAAGGITAATLSSSLNGCTHPGTSPKEFLRWTWVHGGGDRTLAQWREQYDRLAEAGFHGVLVGGGETGIHAEASRQAGLELHRWVWTLNRNGDEWVKANHPEWFTVSRNGNSSLTHPPYVGYYKWLCPTRPAVREYLSNSMLSVAREPGVQGVHLDYVRHCDVILPRGLWSTYDLVQDREYPEFDFCYCDVCRESFASLHGTDPLEFPDPSADERWRRFRWESVTGLVRALAEVVHSVERPESEPSSRLREAPGKPISAAVFPTPTIARRLVRQAWDEWPVDAVFPMLYHSFYEEGLEWIGIGVADGLRNLENPSNSPEDDPSRQTARHLFAGLYLPALSPDERLDATNIARKAGAHGVSFFEMGSIGF